MADTDEKVLKITAVDNTAAAFKSVADNYAKMDRAAQDIYKNMGSSSFNYFNAVKGAVQSVGTSYTTLLTGAQATNRVMQQGGAAIGVVGKQATFAKGALQAAALAAQGVSVQSKAAGASGGGAMNLLTASVSQGTSAILSMAKGWVGLVGTIEGARRSYIGFGQLDTKMRLMQGRIGATKEEMQGLEETIAKISRTTGDSSEDSIKAFNKVYNAVGRNHEQARRVLPDLAIMAAGAGSGITEFSEIFTDTMRNFKIPADQAHLAMEQISYASRKLGVSLQELGPHAASLSESMYAAGYRGVDGLLRMNVILGAAKNATGDVGKAATLLQHILDGVAQEGGPLEKALGYVTGGLRDAIRKSLASGETDDPMGFIISDILAAKDQQKVLDAIGIRQIGVIRALAAAYGTLGPKMSAAQKAAGGMQAGKEILAGSEFAVKRLTASVSDLADKFGQLLDAVGVTWVVENLATAIGGAVKGLQEIIKLWKWIQGQGEKPKWAPDDWTLPGQFAKRPADVQKAIDEGRLKTDDQLKYEGYPAFGIGGAGKRRPKPSAILPELGSLYMPYEDWVKAGRPEDKHKAADEYARRYGLEQKEPTPEDLKRVEEMKARGTHFQQPTAVPYATPMPGTAPQAPWPGTTPQRVVETEQGTQLAHLPGITQSFMAGGEAIRLNAERFSDAVKTWKESINIEDRRNQGGVAWWQQAYQTIKDSITEVGRDLGIEAFRAPLTPEGSEAGTPLAIAAGTGDLDKLPQFAGGASKPLGLMGMQDEGEPPPVKLEETTTTATIKGAVAAGVEMGIKSAWDLFKIPGEAMGGAWMGEPERKGKYDVPTETPGVLTEEDVERQRMADEQRVKDAWRLAPWAMGAGAFDPKHSALRNMVPEMVPGAVRKAGDIAEAAPPRPTVQQMNAARAARRGQKPGVLPPQQVAVPEAGPAAAEAAVAAPAPQEAVAAPQAEAPVGAPSTQAPLAPSQAPTAPAASPAAVAAKAEEERKKPVAIKLSAAQLSALGADKGQGYGSSTDAKYLPASYRAGETGVYAGMPGAGPPGAGGTGYGGGTQLAPPHAGGTGRSRTGTTDTGTAAPPDASGGLKVPTSPEEAPTSVEQQPGLKREEQPAEGGGATAFLAQKRAGFKAEIAGDPALRKMLGAVVSSEQQDPAVIESLMNRTEMLNEQRAKQGKKPLTLKQMLGKRDDSFYGPIKHGYIDEHLRKMDDPAYARKMLEHVDAATGGSHRIGGYTDQGSEGDPNFIAGGTGVNIKGGKIVPPGTKGAERYNDWGITGSREWRERREAAIKAAEARGSARPSVPAQGPLSLEKMTIGGVGAAVRGDGGVPSAGGGAGGGKYKVSGGNIKGVRPELANVVKAASQDLPPGYTVETVSGKDARSTGTTNHPAGIAMDVQIRDPDGKVLPNAGFGPGMKMYEQLHQSMVLRGEKMYPGKKYIWGGGWISKAAGYGDRMHQQVVDESVPGSSKTSGGGYDPVKGAPGDSPFARSLMTKEEREAYRAKVKAAIARGDAPPVAAAPTPKPEAKAPERKPEPKAERKEEKGSDDETVALARGGRLGAGETALVGERGPELFTPHGAGNVIPNHMLGSQPTNIHFKVNDAQVQFARASMRRAADREVREARWNSYSDIGAA
jgi:hypothetical protein